MLALLDSLIQDSRLMRLSTPLLFIAFLFGCGQAEGAPVVGLWESQAVVNAQLKVLARPSYVFTDRQLTEPTVFTGLQLCMKPSRLTENSGPV